MYISKRKLVLLLALLLGLGLTGFLYASNPDLAKSSTLEAVINRGTLIVGSDIPFEPFEFLDDKGTLVGFDVDLVQLMADELGVKLQVKKAGSFDTIIPELNNGDFDIVASDVTRTLQRARDANFTAGYLNTGQIALVSKGRSPGKTAQNYSDLNVAGAIITVQTGTTGEAAATKFFPKADVRRFTTAPLALQEVLDGKADAIIFDDVFLIPAFQQAGSTNVFLCCPVVGQPGSIDDVRTKLNPLTAEVIAFVIRKGDPDFLTWLDLYVEQIKTTIVVTDELAQKFKLPESALGKSILTALQEKWKLR